MRMKINSLIASVFLLSGCTVASFDKPSRYDFETWGKENSSVVEIQIAMLECGYDSIYWNGSMQLIEITMAHLCMKNSGFVSRSDDDYFSCNNKKLLNHPRCALDSVTPSRSLHRRLNSPFCKESPKAYACQPPGSPIPTDAELEMLARQRRIESSRSRDPGTPERKLTEQIQKQNNRGMDQLQRFTK